MHIIHLSFDDHDPMPVSDKIQYRVSKSEDRIVLLIYALVFAPARESPDCSFFGRQLECTGNVVQQIVLILEFKGSMLHDAILRETDLCFPGTRHAKRGVGFRRQAEGGGGRL